MKIIRLKTSFLSVIATLFLCCPSLTSSTLPDITKPYLGEYECQIATLGTTDYTDYFQDIRLELKSDETFILRYKTLDGRRGEENGTYKYDKNTQTVCLSSPKGIKHCCPLKKGVLSLSLPIGDKLLNVQFKQR